MRAVVILALAAFLCSSATAASEQAQAKALEDRWPNCSAVKNGRLGALHPFGDDGLFTMSSIPSLNYTATYAPCQELRTGGQLQITGPSNGWDQPPTWTFTAVPKGGKVAEFFMPVKLGEVAHFESDLVSWSGESKVTAHVTINCGNRGSEITTITPVYGSSKKSGTMEKGAITHFAVLAWSNEACPRFPYSNKGVPAGGVAAIIIVVLCFVIQFSICGWYHKTYSHDVPFRENYQDADAAENAQ